MKHQKPLQKDLNLKRTGHRFVSHNGSRGKNCYFFAAKPLNGKFTENQTKRLLAFFETNTCPTTPEKQELATELGLEVHQIATWFSNRRSRLRRAALKERLNKERSSSYTSVSLEEKPASDQLVAMATAPNSVPLHQYGVTYSQVIDDTVTVQYRRPRIIPSYPSFRLFSTSYQLLHAVPLSSEYSYSFNNVPECLQYCDQLLQNMFGRNWIAKVDLRQN